MRFEPKDPDIATIVRRIDQSIYDLQPDFQRGEVWPMGKKQRLIDSILRNWHVPPIHLVATDGGTYDVLDGQQRLIAIRDFVNGRFAVDGRIEPLDDVLSEIHGMRYGELPVKIRNRFDNFSIRVFQLDDYEPQEPYELFFRLNQPTVLTEAEKRNAFIGGPRNQVKKLVEWAAGEGMNAARLGFSNARMSYDDLIARFLITLDQGTLLEKVTAAKITNRYRDNTPFADRVIEMAQVALAELLKLPVLDESVRRVKPNKATVHTWLCMIAKAHRHGLLDDRRAALVGTIESFELRRLRQAEPSDQDRPDAWLIPIFNDRATSRVADISSVMLRDLTAWMAFHIRSGGTVEAGFLASLPAAWKARSLPSGAGDSALNAWGVLNQWGGDGWF
ncbi:DUF262 domain-containing protein [Actinosynnema sp. NPDC020468]|uniref:DUF262 domain-containing protein n=1 Tax=Actinosynnema sp. NPDC020468 TaxID=3154488 RepID=UPI0033FF490A